MEEIFTTLTEKTDHSVHEEGEDLIVFAPFLP